MRTATLSCLLLLLPLVVAAAEKQTAPATQVQRVETSNLSRLISRVWAKLRAYVPRPDSPSAQAKRAQIAGVRGAESTDSRLQPYWKGDKTKDPSYLAQLKVFNAAMVLVDAGKYRNAESAFRAFTQSYPRSDLNANVALALAAVYGELGQREQALSALQSFSRDYPNHPLHGDAQQLVQALQSL